MKLSDRIQNIEASATVRFTALLAQLAKQGREIIDFAVGEPQYDTPVSVVDATQKALEAQKTKYGPVTGLFELKAELARQFDGYDADNIIVCNGSKQSLYAIFQIICDPGDEIIIPRPCWVSFPQQVKLAGGRPILVDTRNHQLDCDKIKGAVSSKTKAILINSPNNPTGAVYPAKDLETIVQLALDHNLYLVADEAYEFFVYDDLKNESLFQFEAIRNQLVIARSFSKRFNMTGFRIGYVAAARKFIDAMDKLQSHLTGNVCTFAQYGALAALGLDERILGKWHSELERKRDFAYRRASRLFDCIRPQGAFYLFPDVARHLKYGMTSQDFAAHLLENAGVAVVPGEAFGMARHIRISYAVAEDKLISGFEKIAEAI